MKPRIFYFFVGPSVVMMLLLMVLPVFTAAWLGFNFVTFRNLLDPQFIGFDNYLNVLQDPEFWEAFRFTLLYIAITVPSAIVVGFTIALLLDQITFMRGVYISGALLPFIVTPVVGTLVFRVMFDRGGLYNYLLQDWFNYRFIMNEMTVKLLIMLHGIWYVTPFAMIVFFAGLQTLPLEPLEAALVDGATWFQRLRYVIIPHLSSLLVFVSLISIMDAYRVFDSVFVLTKQNPLFNAETLMVYNFKVALSFENLGKANAMSILTIFGIFIVLIPFLYRTYREQIEER